MKTNEVPEKIYLVRTTRIIDEWRRKPSQYAHNIEYTRTDAFIEKACKWLKENKDKYLYNTGEKGKYIPTCSGKIVDEFRKYMKGE